MRDKVQVALEATAEIATTTFGARDQMVKACEEMGELITQLCKRLNGSPTTDDKIVDEIADVLITAHHLRFIYGEEPVDLRVLFKINRTMEYIRNLEEKRKAGL